jgi:plastocyanin
MSRASVVWPLVVFAVLATATSGSSGASANTGTVTGRVILIGEKGKVEPDASNIVVYLDKVPGSDPRRLDVTRTGRITQKDRRFLPEVAVLTAGGEVEFPNEDLIDHNVFSLSRTRLFDLGLYRNPQSKTVTFHRPGVVDVYCNIHPDMFAKIKVMDTIHYAKARPNGNFEISGVPPGTYPIVAWRPHGEEYRGEVTVKSRSTVKVELSLRAGERKASHLNKEGKPYGRYH